MRSSRQIRRDRKQKQRLPRAGEREIGNCLMSIVSIWNDKNVLEMDSSDGWTTL